MTEPEVPPTGESKSDLTVGGSAIDSSTLTGGTNPFYRGTWSGRLVSLDGTATDDFTIDDLAEVVHEGDSGDQWDGTVAAVLRLKDGRFVAYETFYGPTGDGFSEDAYGGTADLSFASTLAAAVAFGLTDEGRRLCGLPEDGAAKRRTEGE